MPQPEKSGVKILKEWEVKGSGGALVSAPGADEPVKVQWFRFSARMPQIYVCNYPGWEKLTKAQQQDVIFQIAYALAEIRRSKRRKSN